MEDYQLNKSVASFIKLESYEISKVNLPPDLLAKITTLKDPIIQLLDYPTFQNPKISIDDQLFIKYLIKNATGYSSRSSAEYQLYPLNSTISKLSSRVQSILKIQEVSTQLELPANVEGLPSHLMRLFAYCYLFPKGHIFVREILVNQWRAFGLLFVDVPEDLDILGGRIRDVENRYFEELLYRGVFHQPVFVFGKEVYSCEMDPVVHDAACRLGEHLSIHIFDRYTSDDHSGVLTQTNHIAFYDTGLSPVNLEKVIHNCRHVKTLMFFNALPIPAVLYVGLYTLLSGLCLLDLSGCQFEEIPLPRMYNLKNLRLSGNVLLKSLDVSLFPCLETLALDGCVQLETVQNFPSSLRCLYLTTLQPFLEGGLFDYNIMVLELFECTNLYGLRIPTGSPTILRIFECPILRAHLPTIVDPGFIEELVLHNCASLVLDYNKIFFHLLQKKPSDSNFCRLKRLELVGLPMLQLPNWVTFAKALQYFMIADCPQLEQLKHLRYVEEMYIYNCPKLQSLSVPLDSLPTLQLLDIRNCPNLSLKHKSYAPNKWLSKIQLGVLGAFSSRSSTAADDKKQASPSQSSSISGTASPSVRAPNFFLDGKLQSQNTVLPMLNPTTQTDTNLLQRVPYFIVKSRMSKTGLRINNRWHTLRLVFRAIRRMRVIVNLRREPTKFHCCLFPGDYEFAREKLIQLWMAVGFLREKHLEVDGKRFFELLLEENYILLAGFDNLTKTRKYKVNFEKVAKLLNGMEVIKTNDVYAMLENDIATLDGSNFWHLSLVSNHFDQATFETLRNFKELRTLLFLPNYGCSLKQIPSYMFLALKSLQALDLSGSHINELPDSIGHAIQLRYLDLSFTLIESLPESIDCLHQLQTLKLEGCRHIHMFPKGMRELTSLRYLDFDVLGQLTCMPKGIGALTELRKLSAFVMDSEERCSIRELKNMSNLEGSFCISNLENASEHDACEATLSNKHLTRLQLRWNDFKSYSPQKQHDIDCTVRHLKPNSCLEELQILYYPGFMLPLWIGSELFQKLVSITFIKCANDELHVTLGKLPNLKHLSIIHMYRLPIINRLVHEINGNTPGTFPRLETLIIDGMPNLKAWNGPCGGDFPVLSKFVIKHCPKLVVLPFLPYLLSLERLELSYCKILTSLSDNQTLPTSLQTLVIDNCPLLKKKCTGGGEDWYKIEHIPHISIDLEDVRCTYDDGAASDDSLTGSLSNSDTDSYVLEE